VCDVELGPSFAVEQLTNNNLTKVHVLRRRRRRRRRKRRGRRRRRRRRTREEKKKKKKKGFFSAQIGFGVRKKLRIQLVLRNISLEVK
jgi:hypothetical protein